MLFGQALGCSKRGLPLPLKWAFCGELQEVMKLPTLIFGETARNRLSPTGNTATNILTDAARHGEPWQLNLSQMETG